MELRKFKDDLKLVWLRSQVLIAIGVVRKDQAWLFVDD